MKPLPTAPNTEAKAARIPKDASPLNQHGSRKHSSSSQQPGIGQDQDLRNLTSPTRPTDPEQHPALRKQASHNQVPSPLQASSGRRQSESSQPPKSAQPPSPIQYQSPKQHDFPKRRIPSTDWNSPVPDDKSPQHEFSSDWAQSSMASPLIEQAMSAKRVSPVMRMHSTNSSDRVPLTKTPEPPVPAMPAETKSPPPKPRVPDRSVERAISRSITSEDQKESISQEPLPEIDHNQLKSSAKEIDSCDTTLERQLSGPELPIQSPTEDDHLLPNQNPSAIKRVPSHRVTIMSSTSDYSRGPTPVGSLDNPVTRETSPALHRNSSGPVPNHSSYGSISFLPMHPLLSPLQDSSEWAADAEKEFERRTSDPPNPPASAPIPEPQLIPAPDDSEGAVNISHPLLLAERHTRFATKTNPPTPKNGRDLPLRHYHSQDVLRNSIFSPSDEKEVFVPPKRSSSLVWDHPTRASSAAINSSLSLPLANSNLSPPSNPASGTPSPLDFTQMRRSLTPQPLNALKSSKASIVEDPSTESLSTVTSASHNATPSAISRGRSPIPQSKSTPNFAVTELSPTDDPSDGGKYKTSATNNTPFYLNPVSSAALIDFLASTPPSTPPGHRAHSPANLVGTGNHGPTDKHVGPFSIFPSSSRPSSPGGRALAALNVRREGTRTMTAPAAASASPNESKKGFKKFFGGSGMKKSKATKQEKPEKQDKQDTLEGLGLVIPEPERYRTKKRTGMKGHKKSGSKGEADVKKQGPNGETKEEGGFMGVGKDGVWISRKNFLKT